jgi:methylthioribose-1-phosphate isomerase
MKVGNTHYRTIVLGSDGFSVDVIDQTRLPHEFAVLNLRSVDDAVFAIKTMVVRGAPLIGATAGYGIALAMHADPSDASLRDAGEKLADSRPTAVNLRWAVERMTMLLRPTPVSKRVEVAYLAAADICEEDVRNCEAIGRNGATLIARARRGDSPVNILTHCNAGWLCAVDWGTALAPIYKAHEAGISLHVWVDETRPRNQGASLTAWELASHGVPHTLIVDNAGGHLMQQGRVDLCIVGSDRTAANGDVCNKIGTYLKALAAHDNGVPFYVALPSSTIDWKLKSGRDIPIEERAGTEVTTITGRLADGKIATVDISPPGTAAANPAFDVTPARFVSALITERDVCPATTAGLARLFSGMGAS